MLCLSAHLQCTCISLSLNLFYHAATPECPDPWIAEGNNCYLFSDQTLPWLDAKIACEVREHRSPFSSLCLLNDKLKAYMKLYLLH